MHAGMADVQPVKAGAPAHRCVPARPKLGGGRAGMQGAGQVREFGRSDPNLPRRERGRSRLHLLWSQADGPKDWKRSPLCFQTAGSGFLVASRLLQTLGEAPALLLLRVGWRCPQSDLLPSLRVTARLLKRSPEALTF